MDDTPIKILILGATGMLGNAMVRVLAEAPSLAISATSRSTEGPSFFAPALGVDFHTGVDVESDDGLARLLSDCDPDIIVNCVGLVKQLADANQVLEAVPINTMLPHRLAQLCRAMGTRLVHVSTDCVFSGIRGGYRETDLPDARDLYGVTKWLGEVAEPHCITLRTSIIGHELRTRHGLLEWFLSQNGSVKGFRQAIFSGVPTVELARIVRDHIIPRPDLGGLYHVSAEPIAKYDLLRLFAAEYGRATEILPDDALVIDRSLNSDRFRAETGYQPPSWPELVAAMHHFG